MSAGHEPDEPKTLSDSIKDKIAESQSPSGSSSKDGPMTLADSIRNKIEQQQSGTAVKHDWTFFFFITIAFILVAAAIAWTSVKTGVYNTESDPPSYTGKAP